MCSFLRSHRFVLLWAGALIHALSTAIPAYAQEPYPSKPLRLVIPYGAGGITDVVGRLMGQRLGEELKQPVVIDNKPGAGGALAAQAVARAAPDGYVLLLGTVSTQVVNSMLYSRLPYDPAAFTSISLMSNSPFVLVTNVIPGVSDTASLVAYARANPGKLNFGSAGNGSTAHLGFELFKLATKTQIVHVPYKSGSESLNAALSDQVQILIDAIPVVGQHVKTGQLRALAIADHQRSSAMPEIRTSVEQGLPAFQIGSWNCLVAPANTPASRVAVLNAALSKAFASAELVAKLAELAINPMPLGPTAYDAHVKSEQDKWSRVITTTGTRLD